MKNKLLVLLCASCLVLCLSVVLDRSPISRGSVAPTLTENEFQARASLSGSGSVLNAEHPFRSLAATNTLFRTADFMWEQPVPEEAFARFKDWADRYRNSLGQGRERLVAEGVTLASERRAVLRELIQTDPQRALELAVPVGVRQNLPAQVVALLEDRVAGRGDFEVLGVLAEPGMEDLVRPNVRTVTINGASYDTYVYGWRLGEPTRYEVPLNGIALDNVMALNENPIRILEPEEAAAAKAVNPDPICSVSGETAGIVGDEVAAEIGEEVTFFCRRIHVIQANGEQIAAEGGAPGPESSDPEASAWTEGQKKLILIRVDFPDLVGVNLSDSGAVNLINNLNSFYSEMSYGRAGFVSNGLGSDFTPVFRMPQPAAYYGTNDYYLQLRSDARSAATAAGYTLGNYNFDVICFGAVPGWSWGGLGYVGAAGSWLRNSFSTGVAGHELGHNFGLNHANYWNTSGQSIIGPGTSSEYGDSFDTMGSASAGNNHFNGRYKNYLNWLTSSEIITATTNGTYRIMTHDNANAYGLRGLRIVKNSNTNYWVEFRQKFTNNKWMMSGAGLRWTQNGNQKSQLLDTTPGSADNKNDSPLVIGRTFSDMDSGIHITPVGKAGTSPESLDVVINLGSFPGNQPPTVDLIASATNVSTGVTVTFDATASDPNGDVLAYYWEFGDGNFGTNGHTAAKSWGSSGEYLVRCVVSDMKGGVASQWVVVRVGSPSTYRIDGQITSSGVLVEGVRVYVSTARMAYSDSDGNYSIVGLPAGSYTVNASLYGYTFAAAGFNNPVAVGPSKTGINFDATSSSGSPPSITTQPQSQSVALGANVTFNVVAGGTSPLSYQWRFNSANISGATGTSYTRNNVQAGDAGNYSVVISNAFGTATSANAALTIATPPLIAAQPQSQTVIAGNAATFTVTATGSTPLAYQWKHAGTNIPGATSSSYTENNVQLSSGGSYSVVVTNSLGSTNSSAAMLTVQYALAALATSGGTAAKTPDFPSYAPGTMVTLTANSTSSFPFGYWSGSVNSSNNPLVVTLNSNMTVTANFVPPVPSLIVDNPQVQFAGSWTLDSSASDEYGADYRTASSIGGGTPSMTATFRPTIPVSAAYDVAVWHPTINRGSSAVPITIAGANTNLALTVDQSSPSGGWMTVATGVVFTQGTNGHLRLDNNGGQGNKNVVADAVRWSYSVIQPGLPPTITSQPVNTNAVAGGMATFKVAASGSGPLFCQWMFNGSAMAGQTNDLLMLAPVQPADQGNYQVIVGNTSGSVTSLVATLTITAPPMLTSIVIQSDGNPLLTVAGTPGDRYAIETSVNLLNWTETGSVTNQSGNVEFLDLNSSNAPVRYYRARIQW